MSENRSNPDKMIGALTLVFLALGEPVLASVPVQTPIQSKIKRIAGVLINTGEVLGIYVSPGLATLIESPCPVSEVIVGNPKDVTRELSDKNPNDVKIFLSSSISLSSNLIIRCPGEVIVLDLYPSRTSHQDYLKIESTFGGPELSGLKLSPVSAAGVSVNEIGEGEENLILIRAGVGKLTVTPSNIKPIESHATENQKLKGKALNEKNT